MKDDYENDLKEKFLGDLNYAMIPNARYDEYKVKHKAYEEYIADHPFIVRGKFNANSDYALGYISYDEHITVGDAYKAYKILMK